MTHKQAKAKELAHIYLNAPNLRERQASEIEARKAGIWRLTQQYIVGHLFGQK